MVADGDDDGISLFSEFVNNDDSSSISSIPELLVYEDSSGDDESMPSLVDRHSDVDYESDDSDNDTKESDECDDNVYLPAFMARENDSDESDEDSWGSHLKNNSDNSDVPYGDMVRGSERYGELEDNDDPNVRPTAATEVYDIDNIEDIVEMDEDRLRFPTTDSDDKSIPSSLDPYPGAY